MTRTLFYGVPAFVGAIDGETKCSFWALHPTTLRWDRTLLIEIDLALSPQAARAGQITAGQILVDDNAPGEPDPGLTTIGPRFPDGHIQGAAWLEQKFYDALGPTTKPPRVPAAPPLTMWCRDYELTSALYWDGELDDRRFYGFHAEITGAAAGGRTPVTIYPAGKSLVPNIQPAGTYWIDLAAHADPNLTTVAPGRPGALFLDRSTTLLLNLSGPKLPLWLGMDDFSTK